MAKTPAGKAQFMGIVWSLAGFILLVLVIAGFIWMMKKDAKSDSMSSTRPAWLPGFIDGDQASVSRPGGEETGFGDFTA